MATVCNQKHDSMRAALNYELNNLPEIRFDPAIAELSCSINAIFDDITVHSNGFRNIKDDDQARIEKVLTTVDQQYESLKQCPEHAPYFAKLDTIVNNLGNALINVFNVLQNNVKPEVDDLKQKIAEEATKYFDKNEVVKNNEIHSIYEVFDWDKYFDQFGGQSSITAAIKDKFNLAPSFTDTDIKVLITDPSLKPTAVNVDNEVSEALTKMVGEDDVAVKVISTVTGEPFNCYNVLIGELRAILSSGKLTDVINLPTVAAQFKTLLDKVDVSQLNVLDSIRDQIIGNIEAANKVFDFVMYASMVIRKRLADVKALVLTKDVLNGDFTDEFLSGGNTFEDISKHIRVRYFAKNREIPNTGIRMDEIVEAKEAVGEQFDVDTAAQQLRMTRSAHMAATKAMETVLMGYLDNVSETRLPTGMTVKQFVRNHAAEVRACVNKLDNTSDNNMEDLLYRFVIDLWYKNTPVASAHNLFGEEVIRQLSINPTLEQKDLDLIDVSVAATVAADFLMKNFIIIK